MERDILILTDKAMIEHDPGPSHPERPDRLRSLIAHLREHGSGDWRWLKPREADRALLERVHDQAYVSRILSLDGCTRTLDGDTATSPGSVRAARLAAGAAVQAVEEVSRDPSHVPFALVRPPGHHAERDRAMGFCLFNNVSVAAAHAIESCGIERVLVVDWDIHHGNGTQHIFEARSDVMYFSIHQWPHYPGSGAADETGIEEGAGYTVNAPMPAGAGDTEYLEAFQTMLVPAADRFRPQLVIVSAGFDAHRDDPLGMMNVTEDGFAEMTQIVDAIAQHHASGRLALVLEGGYNTTSLCSCVTRCMQTVVDE